MSLPTWYFFSISVTHVSRETVKTEPRPPSAGVSEVVCCLSSMRLPRPAVAGETLKHILRHCQSFLAVPSRGKTVGGFDDLQRRDGGS